MLTPRRFLYFGLSQPRFLEILVDPDVVTLRTYEEVHPKGPSPNVEGFVEYIGVTQASSYHLPPVGDPAAGPSPVGRHPEIVNEQRPMNSYRVHSEFRYHVVQGEVLGPHLAGRFFLECASATLDRRFDRTLKEEAWTDAMEWIFDLDQNGFPVVPYCKSHWLKTSAVRSPRISRVLGHSPCLRLFQPFRETPFTECSVYLSAFEGLSFRSPAAFDWIRLERPVQARLPVLPRLRFAAGAPTSVAPGSTVEIAVECVDPETESPVKQTGAEIVVSSDAGYIPVRRLRLDRGGAKFRFQALGLSSGQDVVIQLGFASEPDEAKHGITVE